MPPAPDEKLDLLRDDARVREAFRRGERWALAEVYRVYSPLVGMVVTHGFGGFRGFFNPADRDDALQAIFTAAFDETARQRYNGIDAYAAFLRGIAHNVVRKMLEKGARFRRTDGYENPEDKVTDSAEVSLLDVEEQRVVRQFMDGVQEPMEQAVLDRYFVRGEAEETIAKEIGETRYRVRKTIALLTKRIQVHLKRYGIGA